MMDYPTAAKTPGPVADLAPDGTPVRRTTRVLRGYEHIPVSAAVSRSTSVARPFPRPFPAS